VSAAEIGKIAMLFSKTRIKMLVLRNLKRKTLASDSKVLTLEHTATRRNKHY
jgi:hypothetical protein